MSHAVSAVGPVAHPAAAEATVPLVFVNGMPDPGLSVVSLSLEAPFDERRATIQLPNQAASPLFDLNEAEVTVAVPHVLTDGEVRWQALLSGRVSLDVSDQAMGTDRDQVSVRDRLSLAVSEPITMLSSWSGDDLGLAVVMHRLCDRIDAEWSAPDERLLANALVISTSPRSQTIRERLKPVLDDLGLMIEQTLVFHHGRVRRDLTLVPERLGRRVSLPWPDRDGVGGAVSAITVDRGAKPPRLWIAQGDRPVVEDTFALQPGWDPILQGQPDSDYGRLTSSDYSRFGSVYRTWVLNEDGAYTGPPFDLGPAFDVGALFEQPGRVNEPIGFGSCLVQDASGRRLGPIIESSINSGADWSVYPGQAVVMTGRAGVLLVDDVLPALVLTAAKAGTLQIRVTASLTSPEEIEARQWDGNPFTGPAPTRTLARDDRFAWRTVAPTSIHKDSVDAGSLIADTVDDRPALRAKLQERIAREPGPEVSARLELLGAWTALRAGDRVAEALGRRVAIDGGPSSFSKRDAKVQRVDITFGVSNNTPRTRLRLD